MGGYRARYSSWSVTPRNEPRQQERAYRQHRFTVPSGATEFLLIRHGESEPARPDRPFPLTDGHADPELAPEGVTQAWLLAQRLAGSRARVSEAARQQIDPGQRIDAIYVSSLRRTAQTAAPLADLLGLTLRVEPQLREVGLGEWEGGLYRKMVAENHPVAQRMWAEERWDVIPGAEPGQEFAARVRDAIERLAAAHPDQRLAVFTHGGVIGQVLALAAGSRLFAFTGADNASISYLVVADGWWIIRGYNDTAHLDPAFGRAGRRVTS
jgi:2,3-bisphosphoglycerate-dependent phosphoglycerate mutase